MLRRRVVLRTVLACSLWITFGAAIHLDFRAETRRERSSKENGFATLAEHCPGNLIDVDRSPVLGNLYARSYRCVCPWPTCEVHAFGMQAGHRSAQPTYEDTVQDAY
jgi:hypothetical protein